MFSEGCADMVQSLGDGLANEPCTAPYPYIHIPQHCIYINTKGPYTRTNTRTYTLVREAHLHSSGMRLGVPPPKYTVLSGARDVCTLLCHVDAKVSISLWRILAYTSDWSI
ncbi:hypothetical protein EON63_04120 [archaeon]|nr:MAG: hypothetical protein EON63_04120 [archaeon]